MIKNLTCEYQTNPLGLGVKIPRLSWQMHSERRGARQAAYQVRAAANPAEMVRGKKPLWDTGKVASDQSLHIPYGGPALQSGQRVYWQVRIWDEHDRDSAWSEPAWFEMGLLETSDWAADWITPAWEEDTKQSQPAPLLRHSFSLDGAVQAARLYVTSLGLYELHLNGQRVGEGVLTPGWTAYDSYLQYQTYDVTHLLMAGENALGVILADGWYRGWLGFEGNRNTWGDQLGLLLQLQVTYADGKTATITSNENWRAALGPVRLADIYMGEAYDARLEMPGWATPGFDDRDWQPVKKMSVDKSTLIAQSGPFVKTQEELKPVRLFKTPAGETVFDFGQNMVGWVRFSVHGPAGTKVTLRHAEVLDQQGNMYLANLRTAKQMVQYTLKGQGIETYEPRFTFMGFQFVSVEGWPGEPTLDSLVGVVVHSDIPSTGEFECSNPLINQLQHNIVWGQKGNFVDVPTDCPQRDERLGWTGDAQVFIRTACFNRDVAGFFTKWLRDLAAEQTPDGGVPMVIPNVMKFGSPFGGAGGGSSAWADAATICPWTIYLCYGDMRILEEQYTSMKRWVEYMRGQAGDSYLWRSGFHFGDWLDFRGRGEMDAAPITDKELIATAFFAYSTSLLQQTAQVLGKQDEAEEYASLLNHIKTAFTSEYVSDNGRVASNSQTSYVLALHFDLLPEYLRPKAAARLAEEVRKFGYHLTTGFVGTPYLCHVLSRFGYTDLAYELLNQESFPSWLYPVKKGATTIWERWDGIKPDGSFQDVGMNSFNHYSYGAIGDWMYRVAAGIDTAGNQPGYHHIVIQPQPGGGLTHVRAALQSPYGNIISAWRLTDADFQMEVTIPANTRATVHIPATALSEVTEGGQPVAQAEGVTLVKIPDHEVVVEVGSGTYHFATAGMNLAKSMANVRHVAGRLDIGSSIGELLADPRTKAVLIKNFGEDVFKGPRVGWIINQPIDALRRFAPHLLTPEKMAELQLEFTNIE